MPEQLPLPIPWKNWKAILTNKKNGSFDPFFCFSIQPRHGNKNGNNIECFAEDAADGESNRIVNETRDEKVPSPYNMDFQAVMKMFNFRKEKVKNKLALQEELGLPVNPKTMMIGVVSRLTDQKGFDLVAHVMDELCQDDIQIVVLGTGDEKYENMFRHFEWKYGGRVSAQIFYNEALAHKIYAASDAFLMPSQFEPCGLSQLISLRYGSLPIVRETGGLKDTVQPYNEYENTGDGFSFSNYNADDMLHVINYANSYNIETKIIER